MWGMCCHGVPDMAQELALSRGQTRNQVGMLVAGGVVTAALGAFAPVEFMSHFIAQLSARR